MCVGESEEGGQQQEATRQEGSRCRGRHPLEMVRLCCTTVCCRSVFFQTTTTITTLILLFLLDMSFKPVTTGKN